MTDTSNIKREPDFALIPELTPTIERVHAVRDFVLELARSSVVYETAVMDGLAKARAQGYRAQAPGRAHSAEQAGGEV